MSNYRGLILKLKEALFKYWKPKNKDLADFIITSILIRNNKVLFVGFPGSGKTTLVRLIAKLLSKDSSLREILGITVGAPEKTLQKVIVTTNITKLLTSGVEEFNIRPIVTARVKFINEINRFSKNVQDSLLSLLEEGYIEYGGKIITTPDYICFADMNPFRGDIDKALKARFLASCFVELPSLQQSHEILNSLLDLSKKNYRSLVDFVEPILSFAELEAIWREVESIFVPTYIKLLSLMIVNAFRVCKYPKLRLYPGYMRLPCLDCEYANEPCSKILEPPDERAIISLIKYAQAHAWLYGRKFVNMEDIFWAAPFTLAHRIELTPTAKSKVPNPWDFLKNTIAELRETKIGTFDAPGTWLKAVAIACKIISPDNIDQKIREILTNYVDAQDDDFALLRRLENLAFGEFGRGDLVIKELYTYAKNKLVVTIRSIKEHLQNKLKLMLRNPNLSYSELKEFIDHLRKYPRMITNAVLEEAYDALDKFRILLNLESLAHLEPLRRILLSLNIALKDVDVLLDKTTTEDISIKNDMVLVRRMGKQLLIIAMKLDIAKKLNSEIKKALTSLKP